MPIDSSNARLHSHQAQQAEREAAGAGARSIRHVRVGRNARKKPRIAPRKAAARSKDYWHYCLAHVREYNQSYNFFRRHEGTPTCSPIRRTRSPATVRPGRWAPARARRGRESAQLFRQRQRPVRPVRRGLARPSRRLRGREAGPGRARSSTPSARRCEVLRLGVGGHARCRSRPSTRRWSSAPPRRQRRRPLDRGSPGRDHPVV